MIIVLKTNAASEQTQELVHWLEQYDIQATPIVGQSSSVLGLVGDTSVLRPENLQQWPVVESVIKVQEPYKKANRKFHPADSLVKVGDVTIGGAQLVVAAGPCSVETEDQIAGIAEHVKAAGATLLRGGAFKPRTSPYSFQGLKAEGLVYMMEARERSGLPIVTEITNPSQIEMFEQHVDMIQVGARNMQNFELLRQLGRLRKPILLKRGLSATIEELLMAAEYILAGGNDQVVLCERGIRTYETATRNTMDISAVPVLKKKTHLPIFIDPSHAGGQAYLVEPLALAGVAAGADGLIIEVHNDPPRALSDGQQSLTPAEFSTLMDKMKKVATAVGRTL